MAEIGPAVIGPITVKPHELAVAALIGAFMGVVGYYLTRKVEGPAERLVGAITS